MVADANRTVMDRIGGLTVALGMGAAIACGATGQAWATEDSSPSGPTGAVSASSDASAPASAAADDPRASKKHRGETTGNSAPGNDNSASAPDADTKPPNVGTTATPNGETDNRHHNDRVHDATHQVTREIPAPGADHTGGSKAAAATSNPSADPVAQSVEELRSGPQESASPPAVSVAAVAVTSPGPADSAPPSSPARQPAGVIANLVSTVVNAVVDPAALAGTTPQTPPASPTVWTLLAFTRRELDPTVSAATASPTPNITSSQARSTVQSGLTVDAATTVSPIPQSLYTGQPSLISNVLALGAAALNAVLTPFGGVLAADTLRIPFITDGVPPFFLLFGLNVTHTEYEGMPVTTFTPPNATGKVVVAIHGGAYVGKATIFHWWTYTDMARQTGATVVVPDYTLSPAGTAETVVPVMTDYISQVIAQNGAANVSVIGDSSGGGLALLAVQELVRRNAAVPGHLVLLSPWLDVSMSDPRSAQINDPLLNVAGLAKYGNEWAGNLSTQSPLVSPLYGSLEGLPPTVVYSSSLDLLTIDALRLRDRVIADDIPNVTFRLRNGELHDWVIYAPLPDAQAERKDLYGDLGI